MEIAVCTDKLVRAFSFQCFRCRGLICYILDEDFTINQPFYVVNHHIRELFGDEGPLISIEKFDRSIVNDVQAQAH